MKLVSIILTLTLCLSDLYCQKGIKFDGEKIEKLPSKIIYELGKVSLYADFDSINGEKIKLYVINHTGDNVMLPAQDGNIYAKMEGVNSEGKWQRAQGHRYSWCGNSYFNPPIIGPGKYQIFWGRYSTKGSLSKIRYKLYNNKLELISNTGFGYLNPAVFEETKFDEMSIRTGKLDLFKEIINNLEILESKKISLRSILHKLSSFPKEETTPLLRKLYLDPKLDHTLRVEVLRSFSNHDQEEAFEYVMNFLNSGDGPYQILYLKTLHLFLSNFEEYRNFLYAKASDPYSNYVFDYVENIFLLKSQQSIDFILSILDNDNYPENLRTYCQFKLETINKDDHGFKISTKTINNKLILFIESKEKFLIKESDLLKAVSIWMSKSNKNMNLGYYKNSIIENLDKEIAIEKNHPYSREVEIREEFTNIINPDALVRFRLKIPKIHDQAITGNSLMSIR